MTPLRCPWCGTDPMYVAYHDHEWGVPERDSRALFEKLVLDGFQAGLSWITILKKRDNFRAAFAGFDPEILASWGTAEVEDLLQNPGIVRHRGKIEGVIKSARAYLAIQTVESFSDFLWKFIGPSDHQDRLSAGQIPTATATSHAMSKALKQAGFTFCGPTITYAFMQAVGMVNDHLVTCHRHDAIAALANPPLNDGLAAS
ncbi:MAG: DNA-3-methyladenine glycosylase I [Candidatus Saccharibacteria bacterium]|nr:DNA-3-methyladenine glycosylase I [Pseudorhodobacter sp.]